MSIQITNDFLAGDQRLLNAFTVTGEPGNGQPQVVRSAEFDEQVAVQHPDLEIVNDQWVKTTGDKNGPIRAGDILNYSVTVQNNGEGDWTKASTWADEKLATLTTNVNELADDAVVVGMIEGTSTSWCAPTQWTSNCGRVTTPDADGNLSHSFDLAAGAKHFFIVRIQVTNDFLAGDQRLRNAFTVSGEPGNGEPGVEDVVEFDETIEAQHPGLAIVDEQWVKTTGDKNGPIRAGDVLNYSVTVQNDGLGDWTEKSGWAAEKLATLTTNVSALSDDAVVNGMIQGTSTSWCAPAQWTVNCGRTTAPDADGNLSHSFPLKAGAKHFFTVQIQITNDFLAGDQQLLNTFTVAGEPGNGEPRIERSVDFAEQVEVQHPDLTIEKQLLTKMNGDKDGPIRAGDLLQFHVAVKNTGKGDWTKGSTWAVERLANFNTDITDLIDDASYAGMNHGTSTYWCAPDSWTVNCGPISTEAPNNQVSHAFDLKSGATRFFNYQVRVSDSYTGDQWLGNTACASGEPGNGEPRVEDCGSLEHAMVVQYPDVELSMAATKSPRPTEPVRAGDRVTYELQLTNTGDGDWNMPSAWAVGNPLSLAMDLSDVIDDGALARSPEGKPSNTATIDANNVLTWVGGLPAGKSQSIEFTVTVGSQAAGTATDLWLKSEATVSGDTRNPALVPSDITREAELEIPVGDRWTMTKKVFNADGHELSAIANVRPGDVLTYQVKAAAAGGWGIPGATLSDDLAGVLDDAELQSDIVFKVGDGPDQLLTLNGGKITTPQFDLPAKGSATITYTVKVPEDVHTGTLHNLASGEVLGEAGSGVLPTSCGTEAKPCETSHRIYNPRPQIEKTVAHVGSVSRGDTLAYTVRVTNPGPGTWTERNPLAIVDDLNRVLDDADLLGTPGAEVTVSTSADPAAGAVAVVDEKIEWSGSLGAGEWIELSYSVKVHEVPSGGNRSLINEACVVQPGTGGAADKVIACDEVRTSLSRDTAEIESPVWGPSDDGCVAPPWIDLPITPGIVYTIEGEVKPGGSVTVTATPRPGYELVVPEGWTPSADGLTASFTVHFPTCEQILFAEPYVEITMGSCSVDGNHTPPTLELVETEGIEYSVEGEVKAGSTVTVTAKAKPGYQLRQGGFSQRWSFSKDRLTATYTVTFPAPECEPGVPGESFISPEVPWWTGPSCTDPNRQPDFRLPETPGLIYTYEGEAKVGSSIVITVVTEDGRKLGRNVHGWSFAADGLSATFTITFSPPRDCESGSNAGVDEGGSGDVSGEIPPIEGGGDSDNGNADSNGEVIDPDPSGDQIVRPLPGLPDPVCVSGVVTMPDLKVILVPGIWYDVEGDMVPGGTIVLTAHTLPGYILEDTAEWMTGDWIVASDRRSATQTITFPSLDDLCSYGETPENPDGSVDPENPVTPEYPGAPGTPAHASASVGGDADSGSGSNGDAQGEGPVGRDLAETGASTQLTMLTLFALGGAALLAAAGGLLLARRRLVGRAR